MSVGHNCHLSNKPGVDDTLILLPPSCQSVLRFMSIQTEHLPTEGCRGVARGGPGVPVTPPW